MRRCPGSLPRSEIAHVGLTEAEARKQHGTVTVLHESFARNDRAVTEQETEGFIKVIAGSRGRILGATIVGPHAGEMISLWGLAIAKGLKLSAIAGMLAPYPTLSEISKGQQVSTMPRWSSAPRSARWSSSCRDICPDHAKLLP